MPGTTAISVSREVLTELKDKGLAQSSFRTGGLKGMAGSLLGALGQMAGGGAAGGSKEAKDLASMGKDECTLKRAGRGLAAFPVLLNNQRVSLPAVHAQCTTDDGLADFYFLDDSRKHVSNKKRGAQCPGDRHRIGVVRGEKCLANLRLDRRENLAVDVIKQINTEQQCQRGTRTGFRINLARHRIADCRWRRAFCKP